MKKIKVGIIGIGFFGEKHAEVFSSMPGVELYAGSTRRQERLRQISERYHITYSYSDYREMLANPEIEAVSVVTHVDSHVAPAVAALQANKHVFLEKPMADSVMNCQTIMAAAEASSGKLMIGHICRFDPRAAIIKQNIVEGKIGRIVSMHATRNLPANIGAEVLDKISPIFGDGIHDVDLMNWFTQSQITQVYARGVRVRNFKNPDIGWAMYDFASGAVGVTETVWMLPENTPFKIDCRFEIIGTEGAIYLNGGNSGLQINDANGFHQPEAVFWPEIHGMRAGALRSELAYFIHCIRENLPITVITPQESLEAVRAVEAAERSCREEQIVKLVR